MDNISKTHTSCKDCIFAKYKDNIQTNCYAGFLTLGNEEGLPQIRHKYGHIVEAYDYYGFDSQSDMGNIEFFIIDGIYCYGKRKKKWGDRFDKDKWLDRLKLENRIYYQSIIFAGGSLGDIKITVKSLLEQKYKPQHITIVRPFNNAIKPTSIIAYMQGLGIKWKIQNIANADLPDKDIIDMVIKTDTYPYHSVFNAGFYIPKDFFEKINDRIYNHTLKFAILLPNSNGDGMVVSTSIHKIYDGNRGQSLISKIKEDGGDKLLIPITQIHPNFPK